MSECRVCRVNPRVVVCVASAFVVLLLARDVRAQSWVVHGDCNNAASSAAFRSDLINSYLGAITSVPPMMATCRGRQPPAQQAKLDACVQRVSDYAVTQIAPPSATRWAGYFTGTGSYGGSGAPLTAQTNASYHGAYGTVQAALPPCLAGNGPGQQVERATLFALLRAVKLADATSGMPRPGDVGYPGTSSILKAVDQIKRMCPGAIVAAYVSGATAGIDGQMPSIGGLNGDVRGRIIVGLPSPTSRPGDVSYYLQLSVDTASATSVTGPGRGQASVVNFVTAGGGLPDGAYIFDWKRDNASNTFVYDPAFGNDLRCQQCHSTGLLEIHPFDNVAEDYGGAVATLGPNPGSWLTDLNSYFAPDIDQLNRAMRGHNPLGNPIVIGAPTRTGNLSTFPNAYADPAMVESDAQVTPTCKNALEAFRLAPEVAKPWSQYTWKEVLWYYWYTGYTAPPLQPAVWLRCNTCHGGGRRPSAIYDTGVNGPRDMLLRYIHGGMMPPGNATVQGMAFATRGEAASCYADWAERRLVAWLEEPGCAP